MTAAPLLDAFQRSLQHPESLGVATTVSSLTKEAATRRKYMPVRRLSSLLFWTGFRSLSAAATELGFNQILSYQWVHRSRLPERVPQNRKADRRKHTPAQKAGCSSCSTASRVLTPTENRAKNAN